MCITSGIIKYKRFNSINRITRVVSHSYTNENMMIKNTIDDVLYYINEGRGDTDIEYVELFLKYYTKSIENQEEIYGKWYKKNKDDNKIKDEIIAKFKNVKI